MTNILEDAIDAVSGDRKRDYGSPDVAHKKIAKFWNVYLEMRKEQDNEISSVDVANMMILLKLARHTETPKRDNYTDIAGYAYCASEILGV
jgi:hypothetical protein